MVDYVLLGGGAFIAGLVDAVVGGGGLVQLPLLLAVFPTHPLAVLFGTNKLASIAGTAGACWHYAKKFTIPRRVVLPAAISAFFASMLGAAAVSYLPSSSVKPLVFFLLLLVGVYTFLKPTFGSSQGRVRFDSVSWPAGLLGLVLGFYDGFLGPGTGSFLIFGFIALLGMDMLQASISAKWVNLATNIAALSFFIYHGDVLWAAGLFMAVMNFLGGQVGARLSLKHGTKFIRVLFLVVVSLLLCKLGFDLFV